jgi:hypothetical protein
VTTFVASLAVFGLAVLAMAVGALVQGRRLRGSCGGSGEACQCSPLAARHCRLREAREAREASG